MVTNHRKRQIIFVDDSPEWLKALEILLREYGESRDIVKVNKDAFLRDYESPHNFDLVDYCFVDLELGVRTKQNRTDKYGLTQILPRIRALAPWIPTACVSVWISNDPKILHELSVSDFDGLYPKELIGGEDEETSAFRTAPNFNRDLWAGILRDLEIKRLSALTGRSVLEVTQLVKDAESIRVVASQEVQDTVYSDLGEDVIREAIAALGLGGSKVSLDQIVTGFSGVYVIKADVFGTADGGTFRSKWLIKMGRSVGKLAREASAHRRIFCRGINRSLIVGQLFPNPVIWKGIGVIAYGFEEQTLTALEVAQQSNFMQLSQAISVIGSALYASPEVCPCDIRKETSMWIGRGKAIQEVVSSNIKPLVISKALIHGDLHLRNILISRGAAMLIDFARSDVGPIAIDAAKLVADTMAFSNPELLVAGNMKWIALKNTKVSVLLEPFEKYMKADDDHHAFNVFLIAFLKRYQSYDDVPSETKELIKNCF